MTIRIILTIDVGPDGASLGKGHSSQFDWIKTREGIDKLLEVFLVLSSNHSIEIPATWFVRSDQIIYKNLGSYNALFDKVSEQINYAEGMHELGWLPQLYTVDNHTNSWNRDGDLLILDDAYKSLCDAGYKIQSTRMGNCFHDNQTMAAINNLGIKYDCSGLPYRMKKDGGWDIDWKLTDNKPYCPSKNDYRIPGSPSYEIIEIPLSMVPIKADYDEQPLARYLNPCFKKEYLWQNLEDVINKSNYIHCVLHPDELMPQGNSFKHPLVAYSQKETLNNLNRLVDVCRQKDDHIQFCAVCEFGSMIKRHIN